MRNKFGSPTFAALLAAIGIVAFVSAMVVFENRQTEEVQAKATAPAKPSVEPMLAYCEDIMLSLLTLSDLAEQKERGAKLEARAKELVKPFPYDSREYRIFSALETEVSSYRSTTESAIRMIDGYLPMRFEFPELNRNIAEQRERMKAAETALKDKAREVHRLLKE